MAALICKAFEGTGIEVEVFDRISRARAALEQLSYSALVVDRGLPDGDGLELVRQLRAVGRVMPCLMLTARDALHDRVEGLDVGADDYLVKPFSMEELVARVRALLRRPAVLQDLAPEHAGLRVVASESSMRCGGESITLAPAELQIMLTLVKAQGRTVRRTALEHAGWGLSEPVTPNALDVALHRLRKKIAAIGSTAEITNLRGHGYALVAS
jgi:DNA-binding response OmpR family regulator